MWTWCEGGKDRTGELGTQQQCQSVEPLEKLALGVWDQRWNVQRHSGGAEAENLELDGAGKTCYHLPHKVEQRNTL